MQNFTIVDTLGTLKACIALAPLMFAPGYVIGWALDLFELRRRRPALRFILAIPLTIAICPMLSYLLTRFLEPGLWAFYIGATAACVLLLAKDRRRPNLAPVSRYVWMAQSLMAMWAVAALGLLVDLQIGNKLYPPIAAYDHSTRVAIMAAIARHMPPNNPFFLHPAVRLRYHYLWMLLCSLPLKVSHLQPRHLTYASVIWCGLGLMCMIALGLKFFLHAANGIERKSLIGVILLCVTGLDIVPILYIGIAARSWLPDMEWWNETQITSWAASVLWVPHHVAALIAGMVAFLLLRHEADASRKRVAVPVIVAGLAFASAAGLSVYVTFTFVVAVVLWLLASVVRKNWREVAIFLAAGAVALVWASPYLSNLSGPGGGTAFAEFSLRPFSSGIALLQKLGISLQTRIALTAATAMFLPINYALELGFFLAVGVLRLRQLFRGTVEASTNELAGWTLVMASFLIGTFLRSNTTSTNDLGWRCFLPAQLILLLWGTMIVHEWYFGGGAPQPAPHPWARIVLATLLILGALGTTYQMLMLRVFPVLYDRGDITGLSWVVQDRQFGKRTYAVRSAYEALDKQMPASAVLQNNPLTENPIPHILYSGHGSAAATPPRDPPCGTAFGGDPRLCALRIPRLAALFEQSDGSSLDATCREYGIDAVVVEDSDRTWQDPSSWIWSRRPIVSNDYVRAFRCATAMESIHP